MKILIGADLVPTKTNVKQFEEGNTEYLLGKELSLLISSADYRIFNLDVPFSDTKEPIYKNGPNLITSKASVIGYKAIGTDLLTLANNHILDQGEQGLTSTIKTLDEYGIRHLGASTTRENAAQPFIFNCCGKAIGIYACAEHEFSITGLNSSGANPYDPLESFDHVFELKKNSDYVIVLYHGGKEHYRYPSPDLQRTCRKFIDKGANLVICQHSHCVGCQEVYHGGTIVYGQGNFLFDHSESEFWKTGLLIQIKDNFVLSYIPLVKKGNVVRLADRNQAESIVEDFEKRSTEITQEGFVDKKYAEFAQSQLVNYLYSISGKKSILFRAINKLTGYKFSKWYLSRKYNKKNSLVLQNIVECEAHRELLLEGLKNQSI